MPEFVDGPELSRRLKKALKGAKTTSLAVAFWGRGAADALGIQGGRGVRVVCNLLSGGTNPDEIRILRERGVDVRQLNDLHAKCGVVDDMSFLGSSNMSTNGLGAEGAKGSWREANVVYGKARPEIAQMFERFWKDSTAIGDADLDAAAAAWAARRRGDAAVAAGQGNRSLIEVLRSAPEELDALNVRMVVYDTVDDPDDLAVLDKADEKAHKKYGEIFSVYWDWDSMTTEAATGYLVSYDWPARGSIARGILQARDMGKFPDFDENGETFHVAYETDAIEGITFGATDKAAIRTAFHRYVRDGAKGEEEDSRVYNFPLSELAPYLSDAD